MTHFSISTVRDWSSDCVSTRQTIRSNGKGSTINSPSSQKQSETAWQLASQWISRTLAVSIIMAGPGIVGSIADQRLGTSFLAVTGFAVGLVLGTVGLILLAKRFTPPARGKPLAWEDENLESSPDDSRVDHTNKLN